MPKYYKQNSESGKLMPLTGEDIPDMFWTHILMNQEEFVPYRDALDDVEQIRAYYHQLNQDLLRICRERANADRKLPKKKEHSGYVVLSSSEKKHHYKDANYQTRQLDAWETILQTPYVVDFTDKQIDDLTNELFEKEESTSHLMIWRIGITGVSPEGYLAIVREFGQEKVDKNNIIIEINKRANYRTGYWELALLHTKAIRGVPWDMRP